MFSSTTIDWSIGGQSTEFPIGDLETPEMPTTFSYTETPFFQTTQDHHYIDIITYLFEQKKNYLKNNIIL